jgi:serine protease Do
METRLQEITRTSDGQTVDFLLSGLGLTPALIGGVAVNKGELSEILGLVTNVLPTQARILPLPAALLAAARIRAHNHNVPRPWLGITAQEIAGLPPAEWNRLFPARAQPKAGLILTGVLPESPAARAGLRIGDFLLKVNDKPLTSINDFSYLLAQSEAGDTITLQAQRGLASENLTLSVRLGATNDILLPRPRQIVPDILSTLGIVSLSLAPTVAKTLRSAGGRVVLSVEEASPAERAGLQAGDIIEQINGNQITRLSTTPSLPGKLTLTLLRQGKRLKRIILLS